MFQMRYHIKNVLGHSLSCLRSYNKFFFTNIDCVAVILQFSKKVAHSVKNITFHASQTIRENKDKSLTLIIICKGMRELIYELLNPLYYGEFKIIKPVELQREYQKYLTGSLNAIE